MPLHAVYVIAAWSGFAVMALELLSGRMLAPYFGSSIYVWGAVITEFMLALALGYLAGGRASMRRPTLARLAAILLVGALTLLPTVLFADRVLDVISVRVPDPRFGSLLAATVLFLLPTLLLGMIAPYAVRLLVADPATAGRSAGKLYFVSTFGSAAGTLLTSFYLVLYFEIGQLLMGVLGLSALVALAVLALAGRGRAGAAAGAVLALAGAGPARAQTGADAQLLHAEKSLYRQVFVYDDGHTRCLCFTRACTIGRQSCQDRAHPRRLVFEYTQLILGALFLDPTPKRILVIGLGGGTLPRALRELAPDSQMDLVEIDPAVTRVAREYFDFTPDARMRVIEQDGRVFVRGALRQGERYDLILLDAYDQQYIPEHLLTREFLQQVRALLTPGGVVAANTFSSSRLYSNESMTYHDVFGPFYNLRSNNRVILAVNGPLPALSAVQAVAHRFEGPFALLGARTADVLAKFSTLVDWDERARVLTDEYSPANLLNGRSP